MKIKILDTDLYCSTGDYGLDVDDNPVYYEKPLPALPDFY